MEAEQDGRGQQVKGLMELTTDAVTQWALWAGDKHSKGAKCGLREISELQKNTYGKTVKTDLGKRSVLNSPKGTGLQDSSSEGLEA